ncbi:MAG: glycosyltransferase family 4 protein, partial [Anaerovoracaceae bacterium]
MNILLINHYAGSPKYGMEFRPYYLAKQWVKWGHKVTIVGGTYSHLRGKQPTVVGDITEETINGVDYIWLKTNKYEGNGVGRIKSMMTFVHKLTKYKKYFVDKYKPDIVIASSTYPLDIYPAHKIAKAAGGKLVFELHDLWPLSPMELNGYSKNHPFIVIMQRGEDYACKHSDAIVSLLPRADMHLVERGMAKEKFHWVSNGIVKEDWDKTEPIPELMEMELNKYKEEGQFLIGYAGNHGDANSLDSFIDVVAGLKDKKIMGILVGTGAKKDYFVKKVASEGITNVKFFDPIGKPQIPDFLSHLDCLYNGVKNISLFRFGTSFNKI